MLEDRKEQLRGLSPSDRTDFYRREDQQRDARRAEVARRLEPQLTKTEKDLKFVKERIAERKRRGQPAGVYQREVEKLESQLAAEKSRATFLESAGGQANLEYVSERRDHLLKYATDAEAEELEEFETTVEVWNRQPNDANMDKLIEASCRVELAYNNRLKKEVNVGVVYVGSRLVSAGAEDSTAGYPLSASETLTIGVDDVAEVWAVASEANQVIHWLGG